MKVRIKFSKQGSVKFIGHLDIMRYFQKAIRRADIDIKYSEGYSPHQIMSFAAPLGLGLTSVGEYMDIEVNSMESCKDLASRLSGVMVDGIRILSCHKLDDHAKNAMSLVAKADYLLEFREGKAPVDLDRFMSEFSEFMKQDEIRIIRKTKKGEREVDIRPWIYELCGEDKAIFMKVSAGSTDNLKPELVMEAYCDFIGETLPEYAFLIERREIYGSEGPLERAGAISE